MILNFCGLLAIAIFLSVTKITTRRRLLNSSRYTRENPGYLDGFSLKCYILHGYHGKYIMYYRDSLTNIVMNFVFYTLKEKYPTIFSVSGKA